MKDIKDGVACFEDDNYSFKVLLKSKNFQKKKQKNNFIVERPWSPTKESFQILNFFKNKFLELKQTRKPKQNLRHLNAQRRLSECPLGAFKPLLGAFECPQGVCMLIL